MISRERLDGGMYGTGGMDICDEWQWSGNYYMYLYNGDNLKHNYQIEFWRRGTRRRTIGWICNVKLSLTACNSGEIKVCSIKERSLKKCKDKIFGWINNFEDEAADKKIAKWKEKRRAPVFILEDNQPVIVSHTYGYPSQDFDKKGAYSYWKDCDYDYRYDTKYYTVSNYWNGNFYLSRSERFSCGSSSGSSGFEEKEQHKIIKLLYEQIKCNPKYEFFVNSIKELL